MPQPAKPKSETGKRSQSRRVECRFTIDTFSSPAKCYYFSVKSPQKLSKVITYFEKYPLIGIKGLDYKVFVFV
jgi:hypothetical protein